jgi:hypothetical protein
MTMVETLELSPQAVATFIRQGWVAAPGFFSAAEMADILRWTEEVSDAPEVSGGQMLYREASLLDPDGKVVQRIEDFCPHHAGFDGLMRGARLQAAVEQLFGEPALLFKDKINFKMPGGAGFEAHQDQQAGWSVYAPLFITALVTVDPATLENGCLEMASGPRQIGLIGAEWKPLDEGAASYVAVPTAPGDVLFFDSYAPHASKPNLTAAQRRILYVTYNAATRGDQRGRYYADKRASFPPDVDRRPGDTYRFRV